MGRRHEAREAALRILYQVDLAGSDADQAIVDTASGTLLGPALESSVRGFAERLVRQVIARRDDIDKLIRSGSEHWRLERMALVDRNVIRLALLELLDDPDTPRAVVIDEAVELAKLYGGEESGAFVNGVLDGLRKRLEGVQPGTELGS